MSKPIKPAKRYSPFYTLRNGDMGLASFGVEPREDGIYVEYSDYWKLFEDYVRVKDEVEKLTKAGDAMAEQLDFEYTISELSRRWNAAKQGGHR